MSIIACYIINMLESYMTYLIVWVVQYRGHTLHNGMPDDTMIGGRNCLGEREEYAMQHRSLGRVQPIVP